jgi:ribonuclease Z
MMPLPGRFLSSALVRVGGKMILIDCGEGTQVSLRLLGWGFKEISMICFTHFHGDHCSGVPGLLLSMAHSDRTEPLEMVGPPGLRHIVESLCVIARDLPFEIIFHELDAKTPHEIRGDNEYILRTLPLRHRTPCFAYSIELPRRGKFDPAKARALGIPMQEWGALQKSGDPRVVGPARKGLKLAFATDTRPVPELPDFARGADLFICEGLYGDPEKQEKAAQHMHMSFQEAAEIGKAAGVKEMWLTHYSPALPNPKEWRQVARNIFPPARCGRDRMTTTLRFEEEEGA